MPILGNRVQETTNTAGTGTLTLAGAVTGYRAVNTAFANGNVIDYVIDDGSGNWEVGFGTVGTGTLTRDTVITSSNSDTLVSFGAGSKRVFCAANTRSLLPDQTSANGKFLTSNGTTSSWTTVPNAGLANSTITFGATSVALGTTVSNFDSVAIGNTTAAAGKFTTLQASAAATFSPANANVTLSPTGSGQVIMAPATLGSINNIQIGGTTPAAGAFTTLTASSTITLSPANANVLISPTGTGSIGMSPNTPGSINNCAVGNTTPYTGKFTTLETTGNTKLGQSCAVQGSATFPTTGSGIEFAPNISSGINLIQHYDRGGASYMVNRQSASAHEFQLSGTAHSFLNGSGVWGFGVSPSSWTVGAGEFYTVGNAVYQAGTSLLGISSGAYFNAAWKYANSVKRAATFEIADGVFTMSSSTSSGTAGNTATLNQLMVVGSSGIVTIPYLAGSGNRAVYSDASGNLTNSSSDERLKKDVVPLSGSLGRVLQWQPVSYSWVNPETFGAQREVGFIAQQIQAITPEVIGENQTGFLSLDYSKLTADLAGAIQELYKEVTALKAQVQSLAHPV